MKKPEITDRDYQYCRYIWNRLRHEYGKGLTTRQGAKETRLEPLQFSQRMSRNGFKQYVAGRYNVDEVAAFMTRLRRDRIDREKRKQRKIQEVQ